MSVQVSRSARISRETAETKVLCGVTLPPFEGEEEWTQNIKTGLPFFDHMLNQLAFHGRMKLEIQAEGDVEVDSHHTVEDVGITLGAALKAALGDGKGIERYGYAVVPMDEVLSQCAVDISGRSFAICEIPFTVERMGNFETECVAEFIRALSRGAGITLHLKMITAGNNHHMAEAGFKSLAVAMRQAVALNEDFRRLPSTKGCL